MKPKYQIGDKVWIINRGKAEEVTITAVALIKDSFKKTIFSYSTTENDSRSVSMYDEEKELFPTKKALINSL